MQPDDTLCFCYHVSLRKVQRFCAREHPRVPSLISECLGAGTGCGWCVPYIRRAWKQAMEGQASGGDLDAAQLDAAQYEALRGRYLKDGTRPVESEELGTEEGGP